jgi:hypothetical protein
MLNISLMGSNPSSMISRNSSNIGHTVLGNSCEMEPKVPSVTNVMMSQASLTFSINSNPLDRRTGLPLKSAEFSTLRKGQNCNTPIKIIVLFWGSYFIKPGLKIKDQSRLT